VTSADDIDPLAAGEMDEVLARAMHEHYVRTQQAKGETPEQNPSLADWEDLEESLKESSRRFAEGIAEKLRAAGCVLVPTPAGAGRRSFQFTDGEVEALAQMEHDRWAADLERDGWRWGRVKDPASKTHPLLVPWSELSEEDRDKDRAAVGGLPSMLLQGGFEIQRASPAA
jgi:hypothetical protein